MRSKENTNKPSRTKKATVGPLEHYESYLRLVYGANWVDTKIAHRLCEEVQAFVQTPAQAPYEILILSMPPQHGKSMTITEALPSWYLCNNPHHHVIEISYNARFAALFGRRNREKLRRFGPTMGVKLAKTPNTSCEFELEQTGGGMLSCGILSGVTGHPCELMIIDDPIKNRSEADSKTHREKLVEEWQNTFKTRLTAGAKVILIQTRWHQDDLAGYILRSEENVRYLNFPCEAQGADPLARKPGQALLPELGKGDKWLADFKKSYTGSSGVRAWNALFQGQPAPAEGVLLKREWWCFYPAHQPPQVNVVLISVDAAFKASETSDFVAIQVWGKRGANFFLLDETHAHLGFSKTLQAIRTHKERYPNAHILIEDAANGSAIIEVLHEEFSQVIAVKPQGGKEARVHAISAVVESGHVFLPQGAPFTGAFIEECAAFPRGRYDDRVDAMSQALNRLLHIHAQDAPRPTADPLPPELQTPKGSHAYINWEEGL
ncbi:phage terminase large subunit [Ruminococcaceae bacterium OttesenSCG-928-N02]|nr:phage terminase large subunit [Ruminococcaceae bacterium OttesenSCG-928-N02]